MEVIVVLLIIVFLIANRGDKKKKKGPTTAWPRTPQDGQSASPAQTPRPMSPVTSAAEDFEEALALLGRKLEAAQVANPAEGAQAGRRAEPTTQAVSRAHARQGESMLRDEDCAGGSMEHVHAEGHSALEDEDCVGGSMEHSHTEGISRADHARRMAAMDARENDSDTLSEGIDARALRRAVVMAEVLGRPKALRRN